MRDDSPVERHTMIGTVPPSALHAAPVTYAARSEQRNVTTAAISSGSARRPSGRPAPTAARTSSRVLPLRAACWSARPPSASHASVAVGPGVTAFERIPSWAYRSATSRDSDSTAATVAGKLRLPLETRRELREVDVGSWSGLTRGEAATRFPEAFARWERGEIGWADGETYDAMSERILAAVRGIADRHPNGRVLVVTHAGPIRAIHAAALGLHVHTYRRMRPVEPNARLSAVCVEDGELTELCSAGRLDELLARDQEIRRKAASQPP